MLSQRDGTALILNEDLAPFLVVQLFRAETTLVGNIEGVNDRRLHLQRTGYGGEITGGLEKVEPAVQDGLQLPLALVELWQLGENQLQVVGIDLTLLGPQLELVNHLRHLFRREHDEIRDRDGDGLGE